MKPMEADNDDGAATITQRQRRNKLHCDESMYGMREGEGF